MSITPSVIRYITVICFTSIIKSVCENREDVRNAFVSQEYLEKFLYIKPRVGSLSANSIPAIHAKELVKFQKMANIPLTGLLDNKTFQAMTWKRCGLPDTGKQLNATLKSTSAPRRVKRYSFQGSQWGVSEIRYRISKYTQRFAKDKIDNEIKKAFDLWAKYSNLTFKQMIDETKHIHIDIRWEKGDHGDGTPMGGPALVVAHAFYPDEGGEVHFNDAEVWTDKFLVPGSINIMQVATHEIGHALGLLHSQKRESIMTPFYREWDREVELDEDDITAIQYMYGKSEFAKKETILLKSIEGKEKQVYLKKRVCQSEKLDGVIMLTNESVYAFIGAYYWEITANGMSDLRVTKQTWKEVPSKIDAVFFWPQKNRLFFFRNDQYWRYSNDSLKLDLDYPRPISDGFKGVPENIQAAFQWDDSSGVYFVRGANYYRYSGIADRKVDPGYPKKLSLWKGLPEIIDSAFKWKNDRTYFFSGKKYYRFNDHQFDVDKNFPRDWRKWWLGCSNVNETKF
ncbi:unnamed protein product [Gordionus sp. m RMFG-2023]